jgi:threonine/homoserine/homoserine lactone efflux protein
MELYLSIIIFAAAASITPGPNNVMIMTSGLNFGIRRSIPHALGISLGFPMMLLALGFGLGSIFDLYPIIHDVIKFIGIIYLIYLAWRIASAASIEDGAAATNPLSFSQAALFQWVNPKAWVMATGAISAFTSNHHAIFTQIVFIAIAFFFAASISVAIWLVFGHQLKTLMKNNRQRQMFNIVMGISLIISVLPVIKELFDSHIF